MSAVDVEGNKVVKPFSSVEGAAKNMETALDSYSEKQLENIKRLSAEMDYGIGGVKEVGAEAYMTQIAKVNKAIEDLRRSTFARIGKDLNEVEATKVMDILDMEQQRMQRMLTKEGGPAGESPLVKRAFPTGKTINPEYGLTPTLESLHESKKAFGKKGRYDLTDASTSDPLTRDTYKQLHDAARETISSTEAHAVLYEKSPEYRQLSDDTWIAGAEADLLDNKLIRMLDAGDDGRAAQDVADAYRAANGMFERGTARMKKMQEGASQYDVVSATMAPMVESSKVLEAAGERIGKKDVFGLPNYLAAAALGGGTQDWKGAIAGAVLPTLIQGMPTGTALYRAGEALPGAVGRYAVPAGIRAVPEERQ